MELSSPIAQPPLSHHNHHYHPPLSPPPLSQPPLSQPPQLTKASFSHLPLSIFEGGLARKLRFHIVNFHLLREVSHESFVFISSTFQILREVSHENFIFTSSSFISTTHSGNIWALPCLALACCSSWTSNARQEKQFFSEQWASVWPRGIMWFFGYRFVIVRVIVWDTWLDQKNLQTNDFRKPFFWKFLMLSWTKLEAAAENEKRKLQKAQRKERNLEQPDCSCRKASPCSFLSPAWRVVTSKSWGKRLKCGRTVRVLEMYSACSANSSINRPSPHSNAHHQVPPVQNRIWPFAYLSNRWRMLLNAYIKASNNLHSKTKDDWWPRSNISKCHRFLKSVLSFSMPQLNFQK